jgi:protein-tyrosine-phosphatase
MSLRVAFVCTGNRFRSPLAAAVFRHDAESFGTLDLDGAPALPEAVALGAELGVDLSRHRSRPIRAGVLEPFDLVVGFERFHLATAVVDGGATREVTYTLPELVALLERLDTPESDPRAKIARAAAARRAGTTFSGVPELADPLGRSPHEQRELAGRVADLTHRLAHGLFG